MPTSSAKTSLSFGIICRGDGKIYCLLEYEGDKPASELVWSSSSVVPHAGTVPSRVVVLGTGQAVLVLPIIATEQYASVFVHDADGHELARAERRIDHRLARVMSKFNSAIHTATVDAIRNCDRHPALDEASILDNLIITTTGGPYHIYQCSCTYVLQDDMNVSDDLTLEVYDQQGQRVSEQACSIGEYIGDMPDMPGVTYRRVRLSARIPMDLDVLVVQVRGKDQQTPQGFLCIQSWDVADLRHRWGETVFAAEDDPRYQEWFEGRRVTHLELEQQKLIQSRMTEQPLFSVIVPLYHTPIEFFCEMADSVLAQSYSKFELILVNSTPHDEELAREVEKYRAADERVRVADLEKNLGITENTNAGIDVASGDFLCFFDHDDVLEPDLLFHYAHAISEHLDTDMLYCDEDKLEDGRYTYPFFKPDWDPILEETNNYVCHMLCVRRSVFDQLDRPDAALDGAQDHSLTLAVGEHARHVEHIKRVMYHWRIHAASTAGRTDVKQESYDAGKLAIERHFERLGMDVDVAEVPGAPHCFNPSYRVAEHPSVSVLAMRAEDNTGAEGFAERLGEQLDYPFERVSVSTHAENDPACIDEIKAFVEAAPTEYVLLMRSDVSFESRDALRQLVGLCSRNDVGMVAPLVVYPDGTMSHSGLVVRPWRIFQGHYLWPRTAIAVRARNVLVHSVSTVEGVVMLAQRDVLKQALAKAPAKLDFLRWGIDAGLRVREQGLSVVVDPSVCAIERQGRRQLSADALATTYENVGQHNILKSVWAQRMLRPDPYYSPFFEQDGYYGLEK